MLSVSRIYMYTTVVYMYIGIAGISTCTAGMYVHIYRALYYVATGSSYR